MNTKKTLSPVAALLVTALLAASPLVADAEAAAASPFDGTPMEKLAGYLGSWEIDATWADGNKLWARNEFTAGLGNAFLDAKTFAKDGDGEVYERYRTVFAFDAASGSFKSYGFTYDGTVSVVDSVAVAGEKGKESITSSWKAGGQELKQEVQLVDENSYTWKVYVRPTGAGEAKGGEWTQIMDGVWKRVD